MHYLDNYLPANVEHCRVWARVDLSALIHNYVVSRDYIHTRNPDAVIISVIKANAYGHGIAPCACALYNAGCRHFAVACIEEGIAVRRALNELDGSPALILILGYTAPAQAALLQQYDLTQTLFSAAYASELHAAAKAAGVVLNVHVKLDTGMHRIGYPAFTEQEAAQTTDDVCALIDGCDAFCVRGLFTHLSDADSGDFCHEQRLRYKRILQALRARGKCPAFCHVCNSPGSMRYPDTLLASTRIGAFLFGVVSPVSPALARDPGCNLFPAEQIRPVMRLQTRIIHLHKAAAGEPVGYGALCRSDHDRTIATLSAGYGDGWLRAYAGSTVTVHTAQGDFQAPTVGRICMDLCMIDVTDIPCCTKDTVTLFGNNTQSLAELARLAGTIAYEIPCLVTARVPRIYHD